MSLASGGLLLFWEESPKPPMYQFLSCAGQDFHHWKYFTSEPPRVVKGGKVKSHTGTSTLLPSRRLKSNVQSWIVHSANLLSVVQLDLSR